MSRATKAQLQIHLCVLMWGFTAILGRLITLPALPLVVWRMGGLAVLLALVPSVWRGVKGTPPRTLLVFSGIGALLALHWVTFYLSIKLANASVGATCMALTPVFLAFVEPPLTGKRFDPRELVLGAAAVVGIAMVLGGVPAGMRLGIAVGVFSGAVVAVFGALNKRYIHDAEALTVTAVEMTAGALLTAIALPFFAGQGPLLPVPGTRDAVLLVVLILACTLLPYWLHLVALRELSAFWVALATNLEPVYAILLAIPILGEHRELAPQFYAGVAVIVGSVFADPLLRRTRNVTTALGS